MDSSTIQSSVRAPRLDEASLFHFFRLPPELIFRILKYYVSILDKIETLMNLPAFRPFLNLQSLWFPPVRRLTSLANIFPPGWYRQKSDPFVLFHVEVDYEDRIYELHTFHTRFMYLKWFWTLKTKTVSIERLRQRFKMRRDLLDPIQETDVLLYQWEDAWRFVTCWVEMDRRVVRWSMDNKTYPLVDGKCRLGGVRKEAIRLVVLEDRSAKITFLGPCGRRRRIRRPRKRTMVQPFLKWGLCRERDVTAVMDKCNCFETQRFYPQQKKVYKFRTSDIQMIHHGFYFATRLDLD